MKTATTKTDDCPICHAEQVQGDTWNNDPISQVEATRMVRLYYALEAGEQELLRRLAVQFTGYDSEEAFIKGSS